jgi:hypothetical protein
MNNYLDLLDTELSINIEMVLESVNGHAEVTVNNCVVYAGPVMDRLNITHLIPLLDPVRIQVQHSGVYLSSLKLDDWEARPQHAWEVNGVFTLDTKIAFYQWQHHATSQGWLLTPVQ